MLPSLLINNVMVSYVKRSCQNSLIPVYQFNWKWYMLFFNVVQLLVSFKYYVNSS